MSVDCYSPLGLISYHLGLDSLTPACRGILESPQGISRVSIAFYLSAFTLTCLLESPFYLAALREQGLNARQKGVAIVLPNLTTHPIVAFVIPWMIHARGGTYVETLTVAEVFAPLVEALMLWKIWRVSATRAFAWSILANLFSWWAGIYLMQLWAR